ncbi:MAG: inositol monophosphatase [Thermotogae bacterium]|nr:MAG: inositol monophosphatase [Thermotogota bacterium]
MKTVELLSKIAVEAGKIVLDSANERYTMRFKSRSSDIVTEIDIRSQEHIISRLKKEIPEAVFVAEESNETAIPEGEWIFIIDPIDGTLNFSHGLPYFAISIARADGDLLKEGVVYSPASNELFCAETGKGAFLNGRKIYNKKMCSLSEALAVTGWPYNEALMKWTLSSIQTMYNRVQEIRIIGSAALELCYLAAGRCDLYWEVGLKPWDTAAGVVIAREAGISVGGIHSDAYRLQSGEILAAVPSVYEEAKKYLRKDEN